MAGRSTCEASYRIDIAYLRGQALLAPGRRRTLYWQCGGRAAGAVDV